MPFTQFTSGSIAPTPTPNGWNVTGTYPALGAGINLMGVSSTVVGQGALGPLALGILVDGFDPSLDNILFAGPGPVFGLPAGSTISGLTSILAGPAAPPAPALGTPTPAPYAKLPNWRCGNEWDWCLQREFCTQYMPFARTLDVGNRLRVPKAVTPYSVAQSNWAYDTLPNLGRELRESGSIVLPNVAALDVLVHEWRTPLGMWSALWAVQFLFGGFGFVQGSGNLTFRISANSRWLKDLGNVPYQLGLAGEPMYLEAPVVLRPHTVVRLWCSVSPGGLGVLDPAGRVVMAVQGFSWPVE